MQNRPSLAHPNWPEIVDPYGDQLIAGAFNVLAAAAILVIGLWFAAFAAGAVRRIANRHPNMDVTIAGFLASLVRYGIVVFVVLAVLRRFGVETTSLVAVLGAATLAIGLALQGTLSNVAAGVMLILFRPYRIGEFVEAAGRQGTVRAVTLFTTELATTDNVKIVLPNTLCWGQPILNFSANATRRVEVEILLANIADLNQAIALITEAAAADPRVKKLPAPSVRIMKFNDKTITVMARAWADWSDYFDIQSGIAKRAKDALDAAGVPRGAP